MNLSRRIVFLVSLISSAGVAYPAEGLHVKDTVQRATTVDTAVDESILKFLGERDWKSLRDRLPRDRVATLTVLAEAIREQQRTHGTARLTFICTHNSRRSQFAQVWAETAANYFQLEPDRVDVYSGGTEITACNFRTIDSLRRSGFRVTQTDDDEGTSNPTFLLRFSGSEPVLKLSSKVYDRAGNPQSNFIAVMCCAHADESCPTVQGSSHRISLLYDDPKSSDDSPREAATYDARSRQIAREMWVVMGMVAAT